MTTLSLEQIAAKLESQNSADRMVALANLRNVPAAEAVPLIKKVLNDESLQVRSIVPVPHRINGSLEGKTKGPNGVRVTAKRIFITPSFPGSFELEFALSR